MSHNPLLIAPLHYREKKSSSTHQKTDTKFPNQETLTSHPYNPTHSEETPQTARIQKGHPKHNNINWMKRQRNTQQVKEQDKCPPNQIKEEEIGNLPDKEFQIMIVKMIQNLENKMESQINSLETRTEKMQERFNNRRNRRNKKELMYNE